MWNHRLVKQEDGSVKVCEVFYDDEDRPWGFGDAEAIWTEDDDEVRPEDGIEYQLQQMLDAINKPILSREDMIGTAPGVSHD